MPTFMSHVNSDGVYSGPSLYKGDILLVDPSLHLVSLGGLREVTGLICISNQKSFKSLGDLKYIQRDLRLTNNQQIESLGKLKRVAGSVTLRSNFNLRDLSSLVSVGNTLTLSGVDGTVMLDSLERAGFRVLLNSVRCSSLKSLKSVGEPLVLCIGNLPPTDARDDLIIIWYNADLQVSWNYSESIESSTMAEYREEVAKLKNLPLSNLPKLMGTVSARWKPVLYSIMSGNL